MDGEVVGPIVTLQVIGLLGKLVSINTNPFLTMQSALYVDPDYVISFIEGILFVDVPLCFILIYFISDVTIDK